MAVSSTTVTMVRVLAIFHIVVGALLIILGIADGVTSFTTRRFGTGRIFFGVWIGTWMCIAGALGIPGSTPQRTPTRNCFAGIFMGFSITSAVLGGIIISFYSIMIAYASYGFYYAYYSYSAKMALAAVILILGIIEFGIGIWVSICLCIMKPCCTDSQQTVTFPGNIPGYVVAQGVGGGPVAIPMQAPGVTGQTQPFYSYPQAVQTTVGGTVPLQAVSDQPHLVLAPPQHTEKAPKPGQYVPLEEQI
ncbi:uncharacterized protein LOC122947072 isoform X2 [Acropora millepora]|uniref:uncharacterized protein LOC122947072 isoform X2 n=1 Tax=Acropora millepora TaxID=45264 RepID=UPI001CF224FD|nr:uncharacterized protein LOC122947072 isoform X2 [Acropora millepora]